MLEFVSLLYKTNRFHVDVGLFSNGSQKTSKCGKNISDTLAYRLVCHVFVLTTFWRHLWSITEQTHSNMESICSIDLSFWLYTILPMLPSMFWLLKRYFWGWGFASIYFRNFFVQHKWKTSLVNCHCSCVLLNKMGIFDGGNTSVLCSGISVDRVDVCLRMQLLRSDKQSCGGLNFI